MPELDSSAITTLLLQVPLTLFLAWAIYFITKTWYPDWAARQAKQRDDKQALEVMRLDEEFKLESAKLELEERLTAARLESQEKVQLQQLDHVNGGILLVQKTIQDHTQAMHRRLDEAIGDRQNEILKVLEQLKATINLPADPKGDNHE